MFIKLVEEKTIFCMEETLDTLINTGWKLVGPVQHCFRPTTPAYEDGVYIATLINEGENDASRS